MSPQAEEHLPGPLSELEDGSDYLEKPTWRASAPQILATIVQSLLLLSLGMFVSTPTMVIGALHNAESGLTMSGHQASWFAGLLLVNQPLGSLLSGFVQDSLGRKKCMLLVNLPQVAAWFLLYSAHSMSALYTAAVMMGFSIGFLEAPTFSYVGEVCQPHLRGRMASLTGIFVGFGTLLVYLMGAMTDWRTLSAISMAVPLLTIVCMLQIPESPVWLVINGKDEEAKKALAWLRGWVPIESVAKEFKCLKHHIASTRPSAIAPTNPPEYKMVSSDNAGTEPTNVQLTWRDTISSLLEPEMLRPLRLVILFFFFCHCAAFNGSRPYLVLIFRKLHTNVDPFVGPVVAVVCLILGTATCIICIRKVGIRVLSLISMSSCTAIVLTMGIYAYYHENHGLTIPLFPVILFCCLYFCTNLGIGVVPWVLLSEVFPARGKGLGGGISAAFYYISFFGTSKTFLDLDSLLGLSGVCFFYTALGALGVVFVYYCVPETQGKTLVEVESLFRLPNKKQAKRDALI